MYIEERERERNIGRRIYLRSGSGSSVIVGFLGTWGHGDTKTHLDTRGEREILPTH